MKNKSPIERVVPLYIGEELFINLHCTPEDLKELGAGFLFNESVIEKAGDIENIETDEQAIKVTLREGLSAGPDVSGSLSRTSGCGSVAVMMNKKMPAKITANGLNFQQERLPNYINSMLGKTVAYKKTGGVHCSALLSGSGIIALYEDIGRHNTFDKLIGHMVLENIDPGNVFVLTTGRISYEMALKLIFVGMPLVVSLTAATDLAVELAKEFGLSVIGYARGTNYEIYNWKK